MALRGSVIDPITAGIVSGLIVEGIKMIIGLERVRFEALGDKDDFSSTLAQDPSFNAILENAVEHAESFEGALGESRAQHVRDFLGSPEVEAIVRQIFACRLNEEPHSSMRDIREEFLASARLWLGTDASYDNAATSFFAALLASCDRSLEIAIDHGVLAAHEAKSSFRHRALRDELAVIQKNINLLTQSRKPDVGAILEFEKQYRQLVSARYDSLTPPYVDTLRRVPIDDLYVAPRFLGFATKDGEGGSHTATELLSNLYRAVILGNPGGGKSTFAQKLCYDLATDYSRRLFAGRQLTPILVVLRDYGAAKRENESSILQFIETRARSEYQLDPPPDAFKYLLLNGRAVVIFDGLDELLDTRRRQEITQAVESFCTAYPAVPVVVTSRVVGYEQAPLDDRRFAAFRLADFDEEQVSDYVVKWFAANADLLPEQQSRETESFLAESRIVPDLRANPLMLGLMCNIYRGENYIPRNRPDVYKKCAEMLFERWDRSRGLHYSLPFEAHIKPAMTYLASWIYSDEALQGGVTEDQLVDKSIQYLHPDQFEDREEASLAARQFIEYCRGRAWVFTEMGSTARGDRLYQFTHRTFLEYFTALYLTRTYYVPHRLFEVLLPRIASREWDTVAQLAFQIQSEAAAGAGDDLLSALLQAAENDTGAQRWNCLSFAARCLEFMVPSSAVRSDIVRACFSNAITWITQQENRSRRARFSSSSKGGPPMAALVALTAAGAENQITILRTTEELLTQCINEEPEARSVAGLDIAMMLPTLAHRSSREYGEDDTQLTAWAELHKRILDNCFEQIAELAPKHFALCFTAVLRGDVSVQNLVEWHGVESLFRSRTYYLTDLIRVIPIGVNLLLTFLTYKADSTLDPTKLNTDVESTKHIGRLALTVQTPWLELGNSDVGTFWSFIFDDEDLHKANRLQNGRKSLLLDADLLFGVFTLAAAIAEATDFEERAEDRAGGPPRRWLALMQSNEHWPFANLLRRTIAARYDEGASHPVQTELDRCGFTPEQQSFVWRWIGKEIDFVRN